MLIDTHAHLNYLKDPDEAVLEGIQNGVEKFIVPSGNPSDFEPILDLCKRYDCVYGALGIHPSDISTYTDEAMNKIVELSKNEKIVAIGEIGLDYYWDKENIDKKAQEKIFRAQIEIANVLDLPILVHDREAHLDSFNIIKDMKPKRVVMHCFSGSAEFASDCVKEGWYIALGGVVTFKNAKKMKEVAANIPLNSLLLETDCPYLAPHPYRGEENAPKYIPLIAREIANIRDITYEEVMDVTSENARKLFGI